MWRVGFIGLAKSELLLPVCLMGLEWVCTWYHSVPAPLNFYLVWYRWEAWEDFVGRGTCQIAKEVPTSSHLDSEAQCRKCTSRLCITNALLLAMSRSTTGQVGRLYVYQSLIPSALFCSGSRPLSQFPHHVSASDQEYLVVCIPDTVVSISAVSGSPDELSFSTVHAWQGFAPKMCRHLSSRDLS